MCKDIHDELVVSLWWESWSILRDTLDDARSCGSYLWETQLTLASLSNSKLVLTFPVVESFALPFSL
jgi:hypothetical protein